MGEYVQFNNVTKRYLMGEVEITAADGVSFHVAKGDFAVVIGPSGAGKTTVLNILGGMDKCDEGEVIVGDKVVSGLSLRELVYYRRYDIGFVFQFYNLVNNLTAFENVELATQICKNPMPPDRALEIVGLKDRMNNFPSQLSGGEQQRVAIARALAKNPKLLLCDEPTGALDSATGKSVLQLLYDQCAHDGMTIVLITHNQAITPVANRVIKMRSGKVTDVQVNETPAPVASIEW
ncbi:MAG: ABC transporter ATP-binding protein [Bacillota bacterium]